MTTPTQAKDEVKEAMVLLTDSAAWMRKRNSSRSFEPAIETVIAALTAAQARIAELESHAPSLCAPKPKA